MCVCWCSAVICLFVCVLVVRGCVCVLVVRGGVCVCVFWWVGVVCVCVFRMICSPYLSRLTLEDRRLLWEKRAFCQAQSGALPLVLASAPCWEWACLSDIYALLRQWACLNHLDALGLLHAS